MGEANFYYFTCLKLLRFRRITLITDKIISEKKDKRFELFI